MKMLTVLLHRRAQDVVACLGACGLKEECCNLNIRERLGMRRVEVMVDRLDSILTISQMAYSCVAPVGDDSATLHHGLK